MGERELIGVAGLALVFVLLLLRVPVGLALVLVGIGGNYALSLAEPYLRFDPYLKQFKTLLWGTVAHYEFSVVPLFILMGSLAARAQLSRDLFCGFHALLGRWRGGVAMAAIGACAGFGAVCGSSLATASTMGRVALPELRRLNYAPRLATGALAAGGTLGILIPPSVVLVLYAVIVEASILDMFQAAILPGLLAVLLFMVVIGVLVHVSPELAPQRHRFSTAQHRTALRRLIPVLCIFGVMILGLGLGVFTPTPAAAVGVMVVLVYGVALRLRGGEGGLGFAEVRAALLDTAVTAGMIYFIVFGAEVLKGFLARAGLPAALASWASGSGLDPWSLLILTLLLFIVLGCFMDSMTMILVAVPFFWPALVAVNGAEAATGYGMELEHLKIWFGILALVVVELGLITPPVGLNVFIISALARDVRMGDIFIGVLPFFGVELLRTALLVAFPGICLLLPMLL